ncbi:MAG: COX15/CtaA family protein [Proteobacteria bacterium]|nr:COX15/CtaA family protein [Pseudomonadota bacterium]
MSARKLLLFALPLTFLVVVVGSFVRLSDAGLGCPDWPGCYGQLIGVADSETAAALHPDSPYDIKKAWIEVGHRYIAGLLGLLILAAAVADWLARRRLTLTLLLPLLVLFQALLGMLTVTEKLKPLIVVSHLVGGMTILAFIAAAVTKRPLSVPLNRQAHRPLMRWWCLAMIVLALQIILGGWVSSNYAGLACPDFPLCQGGVLPPQVDFSGFSLQRELHQGADGKAVTAAALATIHWVHRSMAIVVLIIFAFFIRTLWQQGAKREARGLLGFTLLQIIIGIINVLFQLPLWAAVAHNAVAAILVVNIAVLGVKLRFQDKIIPQPTAG